MRRAGRPWRNGLDLVRSGSREFQKVRSESAAGALDIVSNTGPESGPSEGRLRALLRSSKRPLGGIARRRT